MKIAESGERYGRFREKNWRLYLKEAGLVTELQDCRSLSLKKQDQKLGGFIS